MKRLVLLFDGTWNTDETSTPTNIVRLREILAESLGEGVAPKDRQASGTVVGGVEHLVFYDSGVGTGLWLDRVVGGAAGLGLTSNIRQGYRFLSRWYAPGDEVYLFGFSRGAYAARSLVGYVAAAGLLRCADCTWERENATWSYYRTPPKDRPPGAREALTAFMHPRDQLVIKCLGVFDTVGSLGVPLNRLRRFNALRHQFHDVVLGSITEINLHAIAIDERRRHFEAALWTKPKFQRYNAERRVEQVWFPGVHADIGGGFPAADGSAPALADIALDWMIKRVRAHSGLDLGAWRSNVDSRWARVEQHDSRAAVYRLWDQQVRAIAAARPTLGRRQAVTGILPHDVTVGEMVHISALERLGWLVPQEGSLVAYAPANLLAVLPALEQAYASPEKPPQLTVVDWDGAPLDPADPAARDRVRECLARARNGLRAPGRA